MRSYRWSIVAAALAAVGASAQPPPAPDVPAEIAAALAKHLGKWRAEQFTVTNGTRAPAGSATWECVAAVGGIGILCTWLHEWPGGTTDRAVDLVGYDSASGSLSFTRVTDRGNAEVVRVTVVGDTLVRRWEDTVDGKPLVGSNEVFMTPSDGADWTQRATVDIAGERVMDLRIEHHRIR